MITFMIPFDKTLRQAQGERRSVESLSQYQYVKKHYETTNNKPQTISDRLDVYNRKS